MIIWPDAGWPAVERASPWRAWNASLKLRRADGTTAPQHLILRYLRERIAVAGDPRRFGHALTGDLKGLWRYRVGDYRIVASIEDNRLVVLIVTIGHRREIYR
jgi:mRNA interferase RelE/StbE